MPKADRKALRRDEETGLPIFIIVNQIKKFCHTEIEEQTAEGDIIHVKMRPSQKFMSRLNEVVIDLIEESIGNARQEDRLDLMPADVPSLDGEEYHDEEGG